MARTSVQDKQKKNRNSIYETYNDVVYVKCVPGSLVHAGFDDPEVSGVLLDRVLGVTRACS